MEEPKP